MALLLLHNYMDSINKRLISKNLVLFILLALVLSGCKIVGSKPGRDNDRTVQDYLAGLGPAIASLDANKIADLIAFPIVIPLSSLDYDDDTEPILNIEEVEIKKEDFIENASKILEKVSEIDFKLEVSIGDPKDGKLEITGGNDQTAAVENAVLYVNLEISEDEAKQALENLMEEIINIFEEAFPEDEENEEDEGEDFVEILEGIVEKIFESPIFKEWPDEFKLELPLECFELTKQGGKWKLDVQAMIDHENNSEITHIVK